jgi:hypothetical protein
MNKSLIKIVFIFVNNLNYNILDRLLRYYFASTMQIALYFFHEKF